MTIKCIRCGEIEESAAKYIGGWIIKYGVNGTLYDNEHFVVGLCPDCQIERSLIVSPPKKDDVGIDVEKVLQTHEMNLLDIGARLLNVEEGMSDKAYNNLLGCLTTIEKRTAKLEREMDRVWEIIRFHGDKFE